MHADGWLLLIHQIPKDPAYLRVKIGRQLARIGALALKNSVYVLPRTEGTLEDFQWVRRSIVEGGGEATVIDVKWLDGLTNDEVASKFKASKDLEYSDLAERVRQLERTSHGRRKRRLSEEERAALHSELARLAERLVEVATTDFFGAGGREVVAGLIAGLRERVEGAGASSSPVAGPARPDGAVWVTRAGIHVDRIASAWLIRRSIDARASFKFVPARGYVKLPGELGFDMFEAEYSHEGDRCTFETLLARFALQEPGLAGIAQVVHDIDLKDTKFRRPETAGVAACLAGLCRTSPSDEERLARGSALFEALLAHYAAEESFR